MVLPRCFFDIAINGVPTGRIVFELFSDVVPRTCENFRCLCTGEKGEGKTTCKPLHYKGTPIHRIVKGFIVQGGDFSNGDGTGGESIYGGMFQDESFKLKHDRPFLLSMANKGPNTNGSQFFITTCPTPHLDGIHVVFGQVVDGKQYVKEIENQKVDANHRPYADVRITNTGELVLMKKGKIVKPKNVKAESGDESESSENSSTSSSSSSSSEEKEQVKKSEEKSKKRKKRKKEKSHKEQKKKHKKKAKEKKKKNEKSKKVTEEVQSSEASDAEASSAGSDAEGPPKPGDLPPDIENGNKKSWLYRYSKSPSPTDPEKPKPVKPVVELKQRDNEVSQSGRKLKGRGVMQYRTPPPPPVPRIDVAGTGRWDRRPWEQRSMEWGRKERERSKDRSKERSRERSKERPKEDDSKDHSRHRSRSESSDDRRRRRKRREHSRRRSRSRERGRRSRERSRDRSRRRSRRHYSSDSKHSRSRSRERSSHRRKGKDRRSHRSSSRSPRGHASEGSKSPSGAQYSKWARHDDTTGTSSDEMEMSADEKEKENTTHSELQQTGGGGGGEASAPNENKTAGEPGLVALSA